MPVDLQEFQQLKDDVDRLRREADKAAGAYDEQMKRLKSEFDCDSIEQAEKMLADLEKQEAKAVKAYERSKASFDEQWGEVLG